MKRGWIVLGCLIIGSIFIHCAGSGMRGLTLYGQYRVMTADYDLVFYATRDYISELGYTFKKMDRETGEIETDYRLGAGLPPGREEAAETGVATTTESRMAFGTEKRARFKAKVEKLDEVQVKLILELMTEIKDLNGSWQMITGDSRTARFTYDKYFENIEGRVLAVKTE